MNYRDDWLYEERLAFVAHQPLAGMVITGLNIDGALSKAEWQAIWNRRHPHIAANLRVSNRYQWRPDAR